MATLCQFLQNVASRFGVKTALLMRRGYRTERWSYQYLWAFSERMANHLKRKGLQPGERVLLWAPNMPEWVGVYFGCLRAGIIIVPLDVLSAPDFVAKVKQETNARYLFVSRINRNQAPELDIPIACIDELPAELEQESPTSSLPFPDEEDIAVIMFTSGTTGEPKGVILTHRNIMFNVQAVTQLVYTRPNSRVLSLLPLSHMLEQVGGLASFLKFGATVVYPASRQPSVVLRILREHHITNIVVVPQILAAFWNAIEREVKKQGKDKVFQLLLCLSSCLPIALRRILLRPVRRQLGGCLQFIICGGAYLDPELARRWELLGVAIVQGYGTTEAAPVVTVNPLKKRKLDSVGRALSGEDLKIAPDGEVLIRGANVTSGYWQKPAATAAAFDNGWYKTGDLGYLDNEGYLYLQGRKKDMIVLASGMNVYAQDVEEALKAYPGVKDACVLGIPTKQGDIQVHAVLLLQEPGLSPEEIIGQANKRLSEYQQVRGVTIWPFPEFPITHTLKVKKQEILAYLLKDDTKDEVVSARPVTQEAAKVPKLYCVVAEIAHVPVENIRPNMTLGEDLNLDSLGRMELLAGVELELGAYVDESLVSATTTIKELETLIASAGEARKEEVHLEWPLNKVVGLFRTALQSCLIFPLLSLVAPLKVKGRENLTGLKSPLIFAANHQSNLDAPVVLAALPLKWRFRTTVAAAADAWFADNRSKTLVATLLFNGFPFSRTDSIRPSLEHCSRLLDRDWSILIFPEGDIIDTGQMEPFKPGVGLMAVELNAPIVPVYIQGLYQVLPKNHVIPRRGHVELRFGTPLRFSPKTSYAEATTTLEKAIRGLASSKAR